MNTFRNRLWVAGLCSFFVLGCSNASEERKKKEAELKKQTEQKTRPMFEALAKVQSHFPTAPGEKRCDDGAIEKELAGRNRALLLVAFPNLERMDKEHKWGTLDVYITDEDIHSMAKNRLTERRSGMAAQRAFKKYEQQPFLGVWKTLTLNHAKALDKETMKGGAMSGRLAVFSSATGQPVCWTNVAVKSSASVKYDAHETFVGQALKDAQSAVTNDLKHNVRRALFAKLPSMTKALQLPSWYAKKL